MPLRYRFLVLPVFLVAGLLAPAPSAAQCEAPTVCTPQPSCFYVSPSVVSYPPSSVVLRNLVLRNPSHCEPPPPPGVFLDSFFDVFFELEVSTDGGITYPPPRMSGSTTATIRMMSPGPGAPIELELLSMQLASAGHPVRVRESPTKISPGQQISTPVGGGYHIDSFFDVFTELSLDGGQSWIEGPQPHLLRITQDSPTPVRVASWGTIKGIYR